MGQLFDLKEKAYKIMEEKNLDHVKFGGKLGLKCGFLLPFIKADTPDEADKIQALKAAIQEILEVTV